ncbi:MAG: hypothetical protein K9G60_06625 [Pseudolabrys sp.]|nr:hypothetical protein [Pseudolabrys sp.]
MPASHERKRQIRAQQKARDKANDKERAQQKARLADQARQAAAIKALAGDDAPPRDIEAFRRDLARRLHVVIGDQQLYWRGCPERVCRRARRCRAPRGVCAGAPPLPPMTPEQQALGIARVGQEIAKALQARGAGEPSAQPFGRRGRPC